VKADVEENRDSTAMNRSYSMTLNPTLLPQSIPTNLRQGIRGNLSEREKYRTASKDGVESGAVKYKILRVVRISSFYLGI
jgi:hypothetical protein